MQITSSQSTDSKLPDSGPHLAGTAMLPLGLPNYSIEVGASSKLLDTNKTLPQAQGSRGDANE